MSRYERSIREKENIELPCKRIVDRHGGTMAKTIALGRTGFPDRFVLLPSYGFSMFAEFKRPGQKPTRVQRYWLDLLKACGHHAEWFDSVEDFVNYLRGNGGPA